MRAENHAPGQAAPSGQVAPDASASLSPEVSPDASAAVSAEVVPGAEVAPGAAAGRKPLDVAGLRRAVLRPGGLWHAVDVEDRTGSTNADLLARALAGAPEGVVLVAEEQSAGRGRKGRIWVSPPRE